MLNLKDIFKKNKEWVNKTKAETPELFEKNIKGQNPSFFWIGCSDARVAANNILELHNDEVFIHRNVANQAINLDLSFQAALEFALDNLNIKQIIVCGHTDCGGIKSVITQNTSKIMSQWLLEVENIFNSHKDEIDKLDNINLQAKLLAKLNIKKQIKNLADTNIVKKKWLNNDHIKLYGLLYNIDTGMLEEICSVNNQEDTKKLD